MMKIGAGAPGGRIKSRLFDLEQNLALIRISFALTFKEELAPSAGNTRGSFRKKKDLRIFGKVTGN